jgi:hypothetical protein
MPAIKMHRLKTLIEIFIVNGRERSFLKMLLDILDQ